MTSRRHRRSISDSETVANQLALLTGLSLAAGPGCARRRYVDLAWPLGCFSCGGSNDWGLTAYQPRCHKMWHLTTEHDWPSSSFAAPGDPRGTGSR